MTSTHEKVAYLPASKYDDWTPEAAAAGVEDALRILEGRWKIIIIFHLFSEPVLRFSELERRIHGVSQKMLSQHLRELENDGVVQRTVYPEVPPKVEYRLTEVGQALCPALDAILRWTELLRDLPHAVAAANAEQS